VKVIPMNCPLETPETADLLLEYCARTMSPESTAILERHIALCPACRNFAEGQRAVWEALDSWEAAPVSADFDRRLYSRIENDQSWRERMWRVLRPLFAYRGIPAAATACLLLTVGVLLDHSGRPVQAPPVIPETAIVDVQAEQVETALDAMDVLSEFNRKANPENPHSKL
jgi:anti-sigma factor RsiW